MRLIADMHISLSTVTFLRTLGHDTVRVNEVLPATSADVEILAWAKSEQRHVLTQDLDFSRLIATSRSAEPSVLSLRLSSSRIDHVNSVLERVLPMVESDLASGAIVTIEDDRIRKRSLPVG